MPIRTLVISSFFALFSLAYSSLSLADDPFVSCADQEVMLESDCDALVSVYNTTNGPDWNRNNGWLENNDPCFWGGVTCDSSEPAARVIRLSLSANNLTGQIPSALGGLTALESLDIYNNRLTGSIPSSLGSLVNLEGTLNLSGSDIGNRFSGSIPSSLGNLTKLTGLSLSSNQLTGSIPSSLGNLIRLTSLRLKYNQLTGQIPDSLGNLVNLEGTLNLSGSFVSPDNEFSGNIPSTLGNLTKLTGLYLDNNKLTGSIPATIGNLTKLTRLLVHENRLTGPIPAELGNLVNLEGTLNLRGSIDGGNRFNGSIPATLGNLTKLTGLLLEHNELTGPIPPELGNLINLTGFLDLSGDIGIGLGGNKFTGPIPDTLSNLTKLSGLSLSYNKLTGSIPDSLGKLTQLSSLFLQENQLSGPLPASLSQLTNLGTLSISDNELSGPVPLSFTQLSSLFTFNFYNTDLCEPRDTAFQQWLEDVPVVVSTGELCDFEGNKKALGENDCLGPAPSCLVSNPINIATGNKFQTEVDYQGGGRFPLVFERYYNSETGEWRHNFDYHIRLGKRLNVLKVDVERPDGRVYTYHSIDGIVWQGDPDVVGRLERLFEEDQPAGWRYVTAQDLVEEYDEQGRITRITRRDGAYHAFHYDESFVIAEDENGHELALGSFYGRILYIITPDEAYYSYDYDENGRLTAVTYPGVGGLEDEIKRQYHYENKGFPKALTGITDERSERYATWAYDEQGRAILSEHAGGADRLAVTYNADGTVKTVGALGEERTYSFVELHGLKRITQIQRQADGHNRTAHYLYDANGFLSQARDYNGVVTDYQYNAAGLQTRRTEAMGTSTERTALTEWHPTLRAPVLITQCRQINFAQSIIHLI
jgi:YD repeat-containing protein